MSCVGRKIPVKPVLAIPPSGCRGEDGHRNGSPAGQSMEEPQMLHNDLRRPMRLHHLIASLFALLIAVFSLTDSAEQEEERAGQSPLRLGFMEGEASFWRPGAEDWAPARLNTPLAAGDELYTGDRASLELQIGARAFVRAGERTQLGLVNHEPDFLQLKVTTGRASLDLRALPQGYTVELDTPNAVFAIEHRSEEHTSELQSPKDLVC